jgi:hypothetical protein
VVDDPGAALGLGAVAAAVPAAVDLHAVADDLHPAVLADRGHPVDGALEAVEDVHRALGVHLEAHRIVVSANLTSGHEAQAAIRLPPGQYATGRVAPGPPE